MKEVVDRSRPARPRQIADPPQLHQRQPVDHPSRHAAGERLGQAGPYQAVAQPRLGRRAAGEQGGAGAKSDERARGQRRFPAPAMICTWVAPPLWVAETVTPSPSARVATIIAVGPMFIWLATL